MSNEQSQKPEQAPEGEGSYSATRRYNRHLADAIEGSDLEAGAEAAREAMAGPEREALERAAEQGKEGPKPSQTATSDAKRSPAKRSP